MAEPIYWTGAGSASELNASRIGSNASSIGGGLTYSSAKYGNGAVCTSDSSWWQTPFSLSTEFCVEYWEKMIVANGTMSNQYQWNNQNGNPLLIVSNSPYMTITVSAGNNNQFQVNPWSAGDLVHWAFVFSASKSITGGKSIAVFQNGIQLTWVAGNGGAGDNKTLPIINTTLLQFGGAGVANAYANGIIDNVKIYSYAKSDFSDRFDERGGINDVISFM